MQATGKGVSIVEVAERCQDANASGANIRPSSPRTVEAFLRSGFDPDDLIFKPPAYFKTKTQDDELAELAFTFFEDGRGKRIEELRAARQELVDEGWRPGDPAAASGAGRAGGEGGATEDMVECERKRLDVLRTRCARAGPCPAALRMPGRSARVLSFYVSRTMWCAQQCARMSSQYVLACHQHACQSASTGTFCTNQHA